MYKIEHLTFPEKHRIILQFPPDQLTTAVEIKGQLQQRFPEKEFFILADHLHSPCCVDVVGAMHIRHDCIVHFGEACFSERNADAILYVLPSVEFDQQFVKAALNSIEESSYVLGQQNYDLSALETQNNHVFLKNNPNFPIDLGCGYFAPKPRDALIFVGSASDQVFERFVLQFEIGHFKSITICDPEERVTKQFQSNFMGLLMKRNKQVEDAQKCQRFGLLINNPTAAYTQRVWHACRALLKQNGKQYYSFSMNQLNEPKLGNFPEVDAYVIISCFRNCIIDTKLYFKLIITPFQLVQAFDQLEYKISSDLSRFKVELDGTDPMVQGQPQEEENRLIFNKGDLIPLNQIFQSLDFYRERKYQGLEVREDLPPAKLEKGLSGIASQYKSEGGF